MTQWLPLLAARVTGPILLDTPVVAQDTQPTMAHDLSPDGSGCVSAGPRAVVEVLGSTD